MQRKSMVEQMKSKIMILDGAMGTMLQQAKLSAEDFGGEDYEGCNEYLNITRPDVIRSIHDAYLRSRSRYHRDQYVWCNFDCACGISIGRSGRSNQSCRGRIAVQARDLIPHRIGLAMSLERWGRPPKPCR